MRGSTRDCRQQYDSNDLESVHRLLPLAEHCTACSEPRGAAISASFRAKAVSIGPRNLGSSPLHANWRERDRSPYWQASASLQQSPLSSHSSSHQQPYGASPPQLSSGARQPQSCPQLSSLSSPEQTPSPHGSPEAQRSQSPMPT